MLGQLVTLTGWSFVAASVCVFVVVAAIVHGAFSLVEHVASRASLEHRARSRET